MEKILNSPVIRSVLWIVILFTINWFTVIFPVVKIGIDMQKELTWQNPAQLEGCHNPFAGIEERVENEDNTPSDYLHNTHVLSTHYLQVVQSYKYHHGNLYFSIHPELLSPPPESFL